MDIYLDTASLDEVKAAVAWGVLRGVTTNPSHVAKAGVRDMRAHIQEICWINHSCGAERHVTCNEDSGDSDLQGVLTFRGMSYTGTFR